MEEKFIRGKVFANDLCVHQSMKLSFYLFAFLSIIFQYNKGLQNQMQNLKKFLLNDGNGKKAIDSNVIDDISSRKISSSLIQFTLGLNY